jgi:hypothetical protein
MVNTVMHLFAPLTHNAYLHLVWVEYVLLAVTVNLDNTVMQMPAVEMESALVALV